MSIWESTQRALSVCPPGESPRSSTLRLADSSAGANR
jgi:hypothetical protein